MKWSIDKKTTVGLGAVLSALISLSLFSYGKLITLRSATNNVQDTYEVIRDIEKLTSQLKDAETGQRGYLLTGDAIYLQPYHSAIAQIDSNLQRLKLATKGKSKQEEYLLALEPVIAAKLAQIKQTIDLSQRNQSAAALQLVKTHEGKQLMQKIRNIIAELEQEQLYLLNQRSQVERDNANQANLLVASNLLLALLFAAVIYQLNQDVTYRQQLEINLREREQQYRLLANSIHQIILVVSPNGEIKFTNQRWLDYTGMTLEAFRAMGWGAVVHPDNLANYQAQWAKLLQSEQAYTWEFRLRHADDLYRWHLSHVVPVKNSQGQVVEWIATITDINDLKAAEQELKQQKQNLFQANKFKDEFLAIISHELRTPLTSILGWANLLKSRRFDSNKTAMGLETIERNAKVQIQLIDDLLNVSRLMRGKIRLNKRSLDLAYIVTKAVTAIQPTAADKQIQIHRNIACDLGLVIGDSERLEQVINNLLSNAIKFTPEGGQITVTLERENKYAQIKVSDTGKGIKPDFLPHIFDIFRQADSSITRESGGLGLGLAIARQLIDMHNGKIFAHSLGEGQGATFTIQLPMLADEKFNTSNETPNGNQSSTTDDLSLENTRILVVDDDPDTRELLEVILAQYQAEVLAVASGKEAVEQIPSFKPNILVSDIGMPQMDGYTLIRKIRTLDSSEESHIPAIALTAYSRMSDHNQALQAGFNQHIAKPVDPQELVAAIKHLKISHSSEAVANSI
ncbi:MULTISPECIES: CHASE3 domain-containing protein [unclassified Anabaena]|uniref:CHASE3 domain-containing protein n=1 Tax=unclassified Anabaena TaxID=2619674 RepID=UPI00082AB369|nr:MULTISPECIES: CHASE3 domain-containing protein [unclassified Anabaena]